MGGFQLPQPFRNWYFEPDPVSGESGSSGADADVAPGIAYVPPASRQQHGARLLDPSDAPTIPGSRQRGWGRTPSSTVYRARTLLIPADLLRDDAVVAAINAALAPVGMGIVLPDLDSRPIRSEGPAAEALRPVAGNGAELLFAFGLLGASALAGAVVPLSSSYAISEAVGVERSVSRRFAEAPLFLGLFTFQIALGAAVALTPVNLITLLIGTQVLQGIVTPIVLIYILILANRREVLGRHANGPVIRVVATVVVVGISIMSLLLLGSPVLGWLGLG